MRRQWKKMPTPNSPQVEDMCASVLDQLVNMVNVDACRKKTSGMSVVHTFVKGPHSAVKPHSPPNHQIDYKILLAVSFFFLNKNFPFLYCALGCTYVSMRKLGPTDSVKDPKVGQWTEKLLLPVCKC